MDTARTNSAVATDNQEVRELLHQIDSFARSQESRWTNKRAAPRREFVTSCEILSIAPDGKTVLTTSATTRDISLHGLGFVSREHFRPNASLIVTLVLPSGDTKHLTGNVVHSRPVRGEWYLTGVKFGQVHDDRLTLDAARHRQTEVTPSALATDQRTPNIKQDRPNEPITARERALQMLAAVTTVRRPPRETVSKVVMMSMSSDYVVRRATIPVLTHIGGQDGIMSLIQLLDDASPVVQAEAAEALALLRASQAVEPLRNLLEHKDKKLALRVAGALGRMGDESGLRVVARVVHSDADLNRQAACVLGIIVGTKFRPNAEGISAARRYLKAKGI